LQGILGPIVDRINAAVSLPVEAAQPALVQGMNGLAACFKGLSPSDDDIFDLEEKAGDEEAVAAAREDLRMVSLRRRIEQAITSVVQVWNGDGEVADVCP
jgi:hypothetical protein